MRRDELNHFFVPMDDMKMLSLNDQVIFKQSHFVVENFASYDAIADEYYDPDAHPTCHNFNHLSRICLERWIPDRFLSRDILEVGAGDSAVAAILYEKGLPLAGLELHDASEKMLAYSRKWQQHGVSTVVSDACSILKEDSSVSLLVASLGDPYNTPVFWAEAARVVRPDGLVLFTLPSFQWASRFRTTLDVNSTHIAEFKLCNNKIVHVPSFIYPLAEQVRRIEEVGFMVVQFTSVGEEALSDKRYLSPKTNVFGANSSSLVWGFMAVRLHTLSR